MSIFYWPRTHVTTLAYISLSTTFKQISLYPFNLVKYLVVHIKFEIADSNREHIKEGFHLIFYSWKLDGFLIQRLKQRIGFSQMKHCWAVWCNNPVGEDWTTFGPGSHFLKIYALRFQKQFCFCNKNWINHRRICVTASNLMDLSQVSSLRKGIFVKAHPCPPQCKHRVFLPKFPIELYFTKKHDISQNLARRVFLPPPLHALHIQTGLCYQLLQILS